MTGLLDSGASRTLAGSAGCEALRGLGLLLKPQVTNCPVANGQSCVSSGSISTSMTLEGKTHLIDGLVFGGV